MPKMRMSAVGTLCANARTLLSLLVSFILQIGLASTFFHTNEILHYVHEQSDHEETSFAKGSIVL